MADNSLRERGIYQSPPPLAGSEPFFSWGSAGASLGLALPLPCARAGGRRGGEDAGEDRAGGAGELGRTCRRQRAKLSLNPNPFPTPPPLRIPPRGLQPPCERKPNTSHPDFGNSTPGAARRRRAGPGQLGTAGPPGRRHLPPPPAGLWVQGGSGLRPLRTRVPSARRSPAAAARPPRPPRTPAPPARPRGERGARGRGLAAALGPRRDRRANSTSRAPSRCCS